MTNLRRAQWLLLPALLAGCTPPDDMAELRDFARQQIERPPGDIEPLPRFVSYQPFTYGAAALRSPFDAPAEVGSVARADGEEVRPDDSRRREALEQFPIGSLGMVGSLGRGDRTWALIRDATGTVHRVTVGNYLGRNHGRVVSVSAFQVDVLEIVPSGDGWVERPQTLTLLSPGAPAATLIE